MEYTAGVYAGCERTVRTLHVVICLKDGGEVAKFVTIGTDASERPCRTCRSRGDDCMAKLRRFFVSAKCFTKKRRKDVVERFCPWRVYPGMWGQRYFLLEIADGFLHSRKGVLLVVDEREVLEQRLGVAFEDDVACRYGQVAA